MSSYLMPNVRKYSAVFSWGELTPEWKSVQVVTDPSIPGLLPASYGNGYRDRGVQLLTPAFLAPDVRRAGSDVRPAFSAVSRARSARGPRHRTTP